jgi:hypothetical protein
MIADALPTPNRDAVGDAGADAGHVLTVIGFNLWATACVRRLDPAFAGLKRHHEAAFFLCVKSRSRRNWAACLSTCCVGHPLRLSSRWGAQHRQRVWREEKL